MWLTIRTPPVGNVVPAVERAVQATMAPAGTTSAALPEALDRPALVPSDVDPFMPEAPKALPLAKPPQAPPAPVMVVAQPPAPPEPPPLNLAFAGRMTAPDGSKVVYVTMGETALVLAPGLELPNGYKVTQINARSVEFSYAALNRTARLDIPPAQKYETR
ncbi:hypothetical protein DIC66_00020 [Rhodoferax lacus]|uniref:Uncharacterized protein n=2 Tax=Rhodoferax lacus TaxID=2184758 RepID=A0A3E1RG42_9BURK|nr:hypothetical protein DIC66_00020 [Rhodoferax lacus]